MIEACKKGEDSKPLPAALELLGAFTSQTMEKIARIASRKGILGCS